MTRQEIDTLERLVGQLDGIHVELSALSRKSPNDAVNKFKLNFINAALADANTLLGSGYRPTGAFDQFNPDDVPSNSDVTFVVSLYMEALEKFRGDNIHMHVGDWCYRTKEKVKILTAPPRKLLNRH